MNFADLIERIEGRVGPDRDLDICIAEAVQPIEWRPYRKGARKMWGYKPGTDDTLFYRVESVPTYTLFLDKALTLLPEGFWWRGGTCCVSSEATVCPDHNNPEHRERLLRECPPSLEHWNEGIEVCLTPGSDAALIRALISACLQARSMMSALASAYREDQQ